jgi:hypothetical protein
MRCLLDGYSAAGLSVDRAIRVRRQAVLEFLDQALGIPDPGTGFAPARRLVVAEFAMVMLYQAHAIAQGCIQGMCGLVTEFLEIVQARGPVALAVHVALATPLARRLEYAVVDAVTIAQELQDQ